jgi:hypothetical protein
LRRIVEIELAKFAVGAEGKLRHGNLRPVIRAAGRVSELVASSLHKQIENLAFIVNHPPQPWREAVAVAP